jgi:molecular chaperone DnaK
MGRRTRRSVSAEPVDSILVEVTPYSLGIETAAYFGHQLIPDLYSVLIRRNTTIPVTKEQIFRTVHPDQDQVEVKVYQGEAPVASANTLLGEFLIIGLKAAQPGDYPSITVRFDFDVNGMLHLRATDRVSSSHGSVSVQATQARLSPDDIAAAYTRLADLIGTDVDDSIEGEGSSQALVLNDEAQALIGRAQALIGSDELAQDQTTELTNLLRAIDQATSQDDLES